MFFVSRAHYHTATKLLGPGLEFKACWAAARPVVAEKVVRSSFFTLLDSPCLRLRGQGDASEGYGMALAMRMDSTGSS
jgi:hypothetical protein